MTKKLGNIDINKIENPKFLKTLSNEELTFLCEKLRTQLLEDVSKYGGHLSSNLGIVEVTVALHKVFDFSKDKIIFDVGHQSYIHKLLTGRKLENIGQKNCVSGFQKISESIYDCYEAGHSSTSISAAEGFAIARDAKGEKYDVVSVIGDASIVNGLAFEALNNIGTDDHKIIIVLNDNEMSITKPKGSLSNYFRKIGSDKIYNKAKRKFMTSVRNSACGSKVFEVARSVKDFFRRVLIHDNTIFENMGLTYIGPVDGHNLKALEKAFSRAKNTTKSSIIHVLTKKGKGYKYAENDKTGYWHGVTPFDLETGKPKSFHEGLISYSHYFADLTLHQLEAHKDAFLITPATLKGSGLENCFASYPDRCIDVGIAEEHALTLAGSLSLNNIHPIVTIYSTFLQRAYDELSHDCARLNANMTLLIDRAGLVGTNGETHQGIYDCAYLKSIPNVTITMPSSKDEALTLYDDSFDKFGIFAIRYPRDFVPTTSDAKHLNLPYGHFKFENADSKASVAVVATGPNGRKLFNELENEKLDVLFANAIYLHPIASENITKLLSKKAILIYDSYGTKEGFPEELEAKLLEAGYKGKIIIKAIPNEFIKQATINEQLVDLGLDVPSILNVLKTLTK